jgi:type IV secretion system protein VirD4
MYRQVRPYTLWQSLEKAFWLWGTLVCLAWAGYGFFKALDVFSQDLLEAGWDKVLGSSEVSAVLVGCAFNSVCSNNLERALEYFDLMLYLTPLFSFVGVGAVLQVFKRYPAYKPIAAGRWAQPRELRKYLEPTSEALVGCVGIIPKLEWLPKVFWSAWNYRVVSLPESEFFEHTLVHGPPGSGKTAGLFRPMLFRAALQGRSAVVFDVKYPDQRQGLLACVGEFRMLERRVEVFTPYAASSSSLDLFVGCEVFDKALEVATIFVPLSEGEDRYYRDQERRLLAALIVDGKLKRGVRLDQILERLNGGIVALEGYVRRNDHLGAKLKTFLELPKDRIAGAMTGLAATLEPFTRGQTPERLAGVGRGIDLERVFRESTLLYIGIPQADVIAGHGALLMRLVKRVVDEVGLRVAETSNDGRVPIGTGVYLDEVLNLGRLDHLENMLATLRSRGIGYVLGVQGDDQGRALYTREVWQAIGKTCRHKIYFLGALDPRDALEVSKVLGETTVFEQTVIQSDGDNGDRQGTTTREARRALVPMEEMLSWPRFHAVVIARNLAPFRVLCCPLFDSRHPDHTLHQRIVELAANLLPLEWPIETTLRTTDPARARLEVAELIVRAVEEQWPCELQRERGKLVRVSLQPPKDAEVPNISNVESEGSKLVLEHCDDIGEEMTNGLIWLKRRTEIELWIQANAKRIKGHADYVTDPISELKGQTLWMPAPAVAEVLGRAYLQKRSIIQHDIDGANHEVVAVNLRHGGLEKLKSRLVTLGIEAGVT